MPEMLQWKTRIAVLWMLVAVGMSAHMILIALDPVALKKAGEWGATAGQGEWLFTALFWLAPLWLAFAVMTMKAASSRWLQLMTGIIFTGLGVWHFFVCGIPLLGPSPFSAPTVHHVLLVGSTAVAAVLIAWNAWTWPGKEGLRGASARNEARRIPL